jgi:hypothetical protein
MNKFKLTDSQINTLQINKSTNQQINSLNIWTYYQHDELKLTNQQTNTVPNWNKLTK